MEFIPEEFIQTILIKINYFENILNNCTLEDYKEAFKTYYIMAYMNINPYLTSSFGEKLINASVVGDEKVVNKIKSFTKDNLSLQKEYIEMDKRRILN